MLVVFSCLHNKKMGRYFLLYWSIFCHVIPKCVYAVKYWRDVIPKLNKKFLCLLLEVNCSLYSILNVMHFVLEREEEGGVSVEYSYCYVALIYI